MISGLSSIVYLLHTCFTTSPELLITAWKDIKSPFNIARTHNPTALKICKASREIVLRYYAPCFGQELHRPVYFDMKRDKIILAGPWAARYFFERCTSSSLQGFEYLILDPANVLTRRLQPDRFPGAQQPSAVEKFAPIYGSVPQLITLKRSAPPTDHPAMELLANIENTQAAVDACDGIHPDSFQFNDSGRLVSARAIMKKHFRRLGKSATRYRQRADARLPKLPVWTWPLIRESTVIELLRRMGCDAARLGGVSEGLSVVAVVER